MNRKIMNVLYQCDDRYAAVTGVSLTSLLENNRGWEKINIYLIDDRIREENRKKFEQLAQRYGRAIAFLDMGGISARLEACGAPKWLGSYAAYGRLFALGMIEEEIDRLLYLDSDTIVTSDLSELYNMDMEGNVCAMVQDSLSYFFYKHIGHRRDEPYYNSGVILFEAAQWKRLGCDAAIFPYITSHAGKLRFPDQDTLNDLFKDIIKRLDVRYNFFVQFLTFGIDESYYLDSLDKKPHYYSREEVKEAGRNAVIYHYCSGDKPWIEDTRCALSDLWDKYLQLSPWAGMRKTERKSPTFMQRVGEAINEYTWPVVRKMYHKLNVYAVDPAVSWLSKRKASRWKRCL